MWGVGVWLRGAAVLCRVEWAVFWGRLSGSLAGRLLQLWDCNGSFHGGEQGVFLAHSVLGVIRHGDADLFVAKGVCQLAGMVPAVGGVGFGGEFYGVTAAEGVAEAGSVEGHGGPW